MLQEVSIWSQAFCDFDNTNKNKVTVTAGQHAGLKGYIAVPATYFPFERLPLELRQRIYKLLFPLRRTVSLDHVSHGINYTYYSQDGSWSRRPPPTRKTSILCVNRAINAEAVEYLYRPTHFTSSSMNSLNTWLEKIGSCRQHLTRLTITKSGQNMISDCYELLADAVRLQYFEVTLPSTFRASLDEHMEKHWGGLKNYLLASGVNRKESLRRLDTVHVRIGPSQMSILNSEGDPMKEITRERQEACKTKLRGKVFDYFVKEVLKRPDPGRTALWVQQQGEHKDVQVARKVGSAPAVPSQRQLQTPVIVIDDD